MTDPPRSPPTPAPAAPDLEVRHEPGEAGAFVVFRDGVRVAEMTYRHRGPGRIVVEHTVVSPTLKGLGVGRRLLDALVEWARTTGTKVGATCSYARTQLEKDRSLHAVFDAGLA